MKRLLFAGAVAFGVLLSPNIAHADIVPTQETTCADDIAVSVTTWVNPFGFDATVDLDGAVFTVPAFSTVTRTDPWVAPTVDFTVTYDGVEGYVQTGTVSTPTLFDPCSIPGTTTTLPSPTTTTAPPTTLVDLPPIVIEQPPPATPILDRSVNTCGTPWERPEDCPDEAVELAFTGQNTDAALILGIGLVLGGGVMVAWERSRRR